MSMPCTIAVSSNPSGPFSPSHRFLTIGLLLGSSAMAFEYMGVATVMPATAEQLGGMHSYGLAFSLFTLAQIMGSAVVGKGDVQFGTKTLFVAGSLLFVLGCIMGALAPSWWLFLVARGTQGLGGRSMQEGLGALFAAAAVAALFAVPLSFRIWRSRGDG